MKPKFAGLVGRRSPLLVDRRGICRDFRGASPIEFSYVEGTANIAVAATTQAGAETILTSAAIAFDGATRVLLEMGLPNVAWSAATAARLAFWANSVDLGSIYFSNGSNDEVAVYFKRYWTPPAGVHTFYLKAWRPSGSMTVAVPGTTYTPYFLRVSAA